jgi:hypothetical protein
LFEINTPLKGFDVDIVLGESYDVSYGIFNHDSADAHPLSLVSVHPTERYTEGTGLYNLIARYLKHPIKERFGLSVTEFISLPREFTEELIRLSAIGAAAKPGGSDREIQELERTMRELEQKNKG